MKIDTGFPKVLHYVRNKSQGLLDSRHLSERHVHTVENTMIRDEKYRLKRTELQQSRQSADNNISDENSE